MRESEEHVTLVELLRACPGLAVTLVAARGVSLPSGCSARVGDPIHRPTKLAADLVIEIRDAKGTVVLVISVEVQRGIDPDKPFTWPAYLWLERLRHRCPSVVLVIATTAEVAAWARRPQVSVDSVTRVIVLGPDDVPAIVDVAAALADPPLATLSAMIHGTRPEGHAVVHAVLEALGDLQGVEAPRYLDLLTRALGAGIMGAIMDELVHTQSTYPDTEEERCAYERFLAKFREYSRNKKRTYRDILREELAYNGSTLDAVTSARVDACDDGRVLREWIRRAFMGKSIDDVFGPPTRWDNDVNPWGG